MAMGKIIPLIAGATAATKQDVFDTVAAHFDEIEVELTALMQRLDKLQNAIDALCSHALGVQNHKNQP